VDTGRESSLQHRHRERQSTTARRIFLRGFDRLIFDISGQSVVEIVFLAIEIEGRGMHNAVGEEFFYISSLRVWKRNESLFRSAQIEGRIVTAHRLLKTFHIAVDIPIEKFEKEAEILRVALMRGCGHQKEVIGHGR